MSQEVKSITVTRERSPHLLLVYLQFNDFICPERHLLGPRRTFLIVPRGQLNIISIFNIVFPLFCP